MMRDVARALLPSSAGAAWRRESWRRARRTAEARASTAVRGPLAPDVVHWREERRLLATGSVAVFAHHDPDGQVRPYVAAHLEALSREGFGIVFVSNCRLQPPALTILARTASVVLSRQNRGYDFGAWQTGLSSFDRRSVHRLLLVNDSVYGPVRPLRPVLERMSAGTSDVWGLTESDAGGGAHVQSYFVLFHAAAHQHPCFAEFWRDLRLVDDKQSVIVLHELGLGRALRSAGLRCSAAFPSAILLPHLAAQAPDAGAGVVARLLHRRTRDGAVSGTRPVNVTHQLWRELVLSEGFPYVKRELLRSNPTRRPDVDTWPDLVLGQASLRTAIDHDLGSAAASPGDR